MNTNIVWDDCGVCGRTHELSQDDCRAIVICPKCGDGYHKLHIEAHLQECSGVALSESPDANYLEWLSL